MRKKIGILSVLLSVIVSLASCGGSDGLPASAPSAKLDGTVTDAVITNGALKVYAFDAGVKGSLIAETTTDANGDFQFDSFTSPDRPILLEVSDGRYTEEASGVSVNLLSGQVLRAYMFYEQGSEVTVQVTPLTHLASCLADYKIRSGVNVNNAITEATSVFSGLAGIDILGTKPLDITNPNNADFQVTDSLRYGAMLAAISSFTAKVSETNGVTPHRFNQNSSIYATQVLCQDISLDGIFNGLGTIGNGSAGQLSLGSVALDANTFRTSIAQHILSIISSDRNATGLGVDDFVLYANEVASTTDAIFGGVPSTSVDQEGPVVTATLAPDSFLKGIVDLSFTVTDPIGVKSVQFQVNDVAHSSTQIDNPVLSLNTSNYTDGIIKISVVATDVLNNQSSVDFNYAVDNTSPTIILTSPLLVANKSYTATGSYQEEGAPVSAIVVNGVNASIDTDLKTWSAAITLISGDNILSVVITDTATNMSVANINVGVDLIYPSISARGSSHRFTTFEGQYNLCTYGIFDDVSAASNPICVSTDNISLNGAALGAGLSNNDYAVIEFIPSDPQGAGVFTEFQNLNVEYKYDVDGVMKQDWLPVPKSASTQDVSYYIPMTTELLGDLWYQTTTDSLHEITVRVTDQAGNSVIHVWKVKVDILVPEIVIATSIDNAVITNNTYSTRFAVDGSLLNVNYSFSNNSNSPFYISLNDSTNHVLEHTYKTAVKENYARVINQNEERFYGGSDPAFQGVTTVYNGVSSPRNLITPVSQGSYVQYYTDSPPEPSGTTPWQYVANAEVCQNNPVKTTSAPPPPMNGTIVTYSTFNTNPALTGEFGASISVFATTPNLTCNQALTYNGGFFSVPVLSSSWERRVHVFNDFKSGFPSVVYKNKTDQSGFNTEDILVFNDDLGQQILPTNGWYLIPKNTNIAIVKKVRLPVINHYTDAEVFSPVVFTSYTELGIDTSSKWIIDTDLQINRVIDTGDINTLDSASKTTETVGLGLAAYTISR